jgi:branched-chain amino acid transport system ATP-binding protein
MSQPAQAASYADVLLSAEKIDIGYGRVDVVHGVDLTVKRGQIVAIIGPNGAGKTTLLNGLMGLLPVRGCLSFFGETMADQPTVEMLVGRGVTLIPETRELFGPMNVEDNLRLGAFARYRKGDRDIDAGLAEVYALMPRLQERKAQAASTLSGGERQMLAMGRALMSRPQLLLLDEPSLGLAPLITRDILRTVASLRDRGMSCLLVEQNAKAALRIADYAYVMEQGSFVLQGPAGEVADNPDVINSYLGVRSAAAAEASRS